MLRAVDDLQHQRVAMALSEKAPELVALAEDAHITATHWSR
jgi:hypothetical protein